MAEITPFSDIYNKFYGKITDDMYMEMTQLETEADSESLLLDTLTNFEFPRFKLYDYDVTLKTYNTNLTSEEINVLATLMLIGWLQRQLASVENTRMKYSGSDFKFTSQANHLDKLIKLKKEFELNSKHLQNLYKRRKITEDGYIAPNLSSIMGRSVL